MQRTHMATGLDLAYGHEGESLVTAITEIELAHDVFVNVTQEHGPAAAGPSWT